MSGKAIVLHPSGVEEQLLDKPGLEAAQRAVGGYVQMVELTDGRQMLMDEDGLFSTKPCNPEATKLAFEAGVLFDPQRGVVGTVLILEGSYRWE